MSHYNPQIIQPMEFFPVSSFTTLDDVPNKDKFIQTSIPRHAPPGHVLHTHFHDEVKVSEKVMHSGKFQYASFIKFM